jgi:hypothetical protein
VRLLLALSEAVTSARERRDSLLRETHYRYRVVVDLSYTREPFNCLLVDSGSVVAVRVKALFSLSPKALAFIEECDI